MSSIKLAISVFVLLSISRFIPHPPNFTSLIALSFYVPALFGIRYISITLFSFLITDLIIGFHATVLFTWGSVVLIGLLTKYFHKSLTFRFCGVLVSALLFFLISNFGVWMNGSYSYSLEGLISCYILALPFFGNTLVSTIIFSSIIETLLFFMKFKKKINFLK